MNAYFYIGPVIGVVVTVVTLVFVFKFLGGLQKAAKEEQRILAVGHPAAGQIVAVQQTGTYINNQPQVVIVVQVYPQQGQPYQATITKVVNMFQIPQFQIGAQVGVRIDPQNPMKVAIAGAMQPVMMQAPMQPPPGMGGYGYPMQQPPQQGQWPGQPPGQYPRG